jgi:hypothetical protein
MSNFLDIQQLRNETTKKREKRIEVFDKILKLCHGRIVRASKKENSSCLYKVPEMKVGMPVYNIKECTAYLILNLKKNGFKVKYIPPNALHIDWKKDNDPITTKTIKAYQTEDDALLLEDFIPINTSKENKNKDYFRNISTINNSNIYDDELISSFQNMTTNVNKNKY